MGKKRHLTKEEIGFVREWMDSSPQGRKPSVRQISKRLNVNRPSVIKSLGGWKGIQRGRESSEPGKPKHRLELGGSMVEIQPFTTDVSEAMNGTPKGV